ncbi:MAG: PEP-CTERM sorting domain-containing protein [Verrucomicrobia bacterium]|nr:PEP-CTERM sorting domain-containing protein [Verrucomicrobiota bacterium]
MLRSSPLALLAAFVLLAINAVAQTIVFTPSTTALNTAGGSITFTATISYSSPPSVLAFTTTLPTGWTYVSGTNEPPVKPSTGTTGTLGWSYTTTVPGSPITFDFTATYPASLTGLQPLTTSTVTRDTTDSPAVTTPGPTVTLSAPPTSFTWVGSGVGQTGNWNDVNLWSPTGTVPNNTGLATYSAQVSAGTATIFTGTTITLNDLLLFGGTINGGGALTLVGTNSSWTSGAITSLTQLTIASGAIFTASTLASHDFDQTAIVNQGTFLWQNGGSLRSGSGGSFVNASGATFTDSTSGAVPYVITNGFGGTFTFSNAGSYVKSSGSATRIEVPFTNSGSVLVEAGTLRFTSTFSQSAGLLHVASGTSATFDNPATFTNGSIIGGGTIQGSVTVGAATGSVAVVSPGDSLGQLTFQGNLTLLNTSMLLVELGGTGQGVTYDFVSVSGTAALGGTLSLMFQNGFSSSASFGTTFTLLSASSLTGTFTNAPNGLRFNTSDGLGSFVVHYTPTSLTLTEFQLTPVPEPSTWALLLAGLGVVGVSVWRRKK